MELGGDDLRRSSGEGRGSKWERSYGGSPMAPRRGGVGLAKKWIRREKRGGSVRDKDELDEQGRTVRP